MRPASGGGMADSRPGSRLDGSRPQTGASATRSASSGPLSSEAPTGNEPPPSAVESSRPTTRYDDRGVPIHEETGVDRQAGAPAYQETWGRPGSAGTAWEDPDDDKRSRMPIIADASAGFNNLFEEWFEPFLIVPIEYVRKSCTSPWVNRRIKDLLALSVPCVCYYALAYHGDPICTDPRRYTVPEEYVVVKVEGVHYAEERFVEAAQAYRNDTQPDHQWLTARPLRRIVCLYEFDMSA